MAAALYKIMQTSRYRVEKGKKNGDNLIIADKGRYIRPVRFCKGTVYSSCESSGNPLVVPVSFAGSEGGAAGVSLACTGGTAAGAGPAVFGKTTGIGAGAITVSRRTFAAPFQTSVRTITSLPDETLQV